MKVNQSSVERVIRAIIGAGFLGLNILGVVTGGWGIVLIALGILLLLTGITGFCPLYALFKIDTSKPG